MALPKIDVPIFSITLPSNDQVIKLRPFTVKEEKILLIANETKDPQEVLNAVIQIANNCILEDGVDAQSIPLVDLQYVFLQLRSKSVGNIAEIMVTDEEDQKQYKVEVDLDSVQIIKPEVNVPNVIQLTDEVGITLKYPTLDLARISQLTTEDLVLFCLVNIFDGDNVYEVSDNTEDELREFISSMSTPHVEKIKEFLEGVPRLQYTVSYTTESGKEKTIEIGNINDFF